MSDRDPNAVTLQGTVLEGGYQLTRLIAEGGMGSVWEAVHIRLNKRVAVKMMAIELAANEEALARFRRELQVTSQLAHPHIIQVWDFGMAPTGQPYLVMEYLDGEDLEQRLERVRRLSLDVTARLIRQTSSALSATHTKGIVHRDLKPANLFLLAVEGDPDFVKVVDFGISKVKSSKTKLTRATLMMGTPAYMAPEQVLGKVDDVDHRTDQWALACIAWQTLSGREPFAAADVNLLLRQIAYEEPAPLSSKGAQIPAEVESVLRRALSKPQGDRFPTISAFGRALEEAAAPKPIIVESKSESSRQRAATPGSGLGLFSRTAATAPPKPESKNGRSAGRLQTVTVLVKTLGSRATAMLMRKKRVNPWRKVAWISAAGIGAVLAVGGALFLKTGWLPWKPTVEVVAPAPVTAPPAPRVVPLRPAKTTGAAARRKATAARLEAAERSASAR